jgi:hypothetical protein
VALGVGFLQRRHGQPLNKALLARLRSGQLSRQDYYWQLLRLVYRLIFAFVAEDRDLLHPPETPAAVRRRYADHYGAARLRRIARQTRGDAHTDAYRGLRLVLGWLRDGQPGLGLPGLGGLLFGPAAAPDLDTAELPNSDLYAALRELAYTRDEQVLRPVDYRNLGALELGSVYEALLEMHPTIDLDAGAFGLGVVAGSERKTTGSYYTPTELVESLLDTALEPVIRERLASSEWRVAGAAHTESRVVSGEWRELNRGGKDDGDRVVSRPAGVATGDGPGDSGVRVDGELAASRTVRPDQSGAPRGGVDTGERGRGLGTPHDGRVSPLSVHRDGLTARAGDPPAAQPADRLHDGGPTGPAAGLGHDSLQATADAATPPKVASGGAADGAVVSGEWSVASGHTTHHSPLATDYSPLTTHHSPVEDALLSLRIVDPACGSGHFLIGAAQRLAARLASIRSGEDEPTPADLRAALRDVVAHCIYGVDLNPMAVELCKIALWLETLDPGRPLSFLDANIQCGNSLLGATPALLARGVPDEAFDSLTGDDKAVAREWKKTNRATHADRAAGRLRLFDPDTHAPWQRLGELGTALAELLASADDTLGDVRAKEELYSEYIKGAPYENSRLWADAWCAAFVMEKSARFDYGLTERRFREIERNPHNLAPWMRAEVQRLAAQYQFLHWHLAFPHIFAPLPASEIHPNDPCGWAGGFDVVLGNPPWERIKLQEIEFFAGRDEAIANAPNAAARRRLIAALETENPPLYAAYRDALHSADGWSHLLRNSGRYPLCGRGDINTYAVFAELARHLTAPTGRAGIIVPSGIATDATTQYFFGDVATSGSLASLYDFENRQKLFPAVDSRMKFCLLTLCGDERPVVEAEFAFFLQGVGDLADPEKRFALSPVEIALINPNTRTCPVFRSRRDAALTKAIYRRVPVLVRDGDEAGGQPEQNPWGISFMRMFDMSNDSALFRTRAQLEAAGYRLAGNVFAREGQRYLPLYEGKMIWQFDHQYASFPAYGDRPSSTGLGEPDEMLHSDPADTPQPWYWVKLEECLHATPDWSRQWLWLFRKTTNSTNERTVVSSVVPYSAVGNKAPILLTGDAVGASDVLLGTTNLDSFALDYVARQKIGGTDISHFYMKQFPVLPPSAYGPAERAFILPRALELTYTAWDLADGEWSMASSEWQEEASAEMASGAAHDSPLAVPNSPFTTHHSPLARAKPPFRWHDCRRAQLRAELDALFFHLYGLARDDVDYVMDTFPIVKRKDEAAHGGHYRTKEAILAVYDQLAALGGAWDRYVSPLDPPPGDDRARHGEETRPSWA